MGEGWGFWERGLEGEMVCWVLLGEVGWDGGCCGEVWGLIFAWGLPLLFLPRLTLCQPLSSLQLLLSGSL